MVKKFLNIIHKEFSGLHEAAFLLAFSSLCSQLLALLRDHLLAGTFGASKTLDIYYAAFRLPDFVYVTIASFVSVTVLIPFLISKIEKKDYLAAREFLNSIFTIFCLVMIAVSAILYFFIPYLTKILAPGFSPADQLQLVTFTRILLWSPFLLGLSNLLGSVTQSLRKFFVYALSPLLYNIGIIVGVTLFYPVLGNVGLVWGVVLGAVLHLLIQLPVLWRQGFFPSLTRSINWSVIGQVVMISLPRTITLATSQLATIVLISMASLMKTGSIAIFNFSFNLQSVPLSIVGVSYSVAAFPALAKMFSSHDEEGYLAQVGNAIRHIFFWSFIFTVLFIVLRAQIVRVILGAGHFNWGDTRLTAACLALFAISIVAQSLCQLIIRAYYAAGKTLTPLIINVVSAGIIVALAFVLQYWFETSVLFRYWLEELLRVSDLPGTAILILPLAFSLGLIFNALVHWVFFQIDFARFPHAIIRSCRQILSAALLAGGGTYGALNLLESLVNIHTTLGIFLQGFLAGLVGLAVFVVILFIFKNVEIEEVTYALTQKFWKTRVVSSGPEGL